MTIDVTDQFIVHAGESFAFTDEYGFNLQGDANPTLVNKGAISLDVTVDGLGSSPLILGYPANNVFVWNRAGASMTVQADAAITTNVVGVDLEGHDSQLRNDGDILVHGGQTTLALMAQLSGFRLDNTGHIDAQGTTIATGAFLATDAHITNSGVISAEGGAAVGVYTHIDIETPGGRLINTGSIQATGETFATAVRLENVSRGYHLDNAGRIVASATGPDDHSYGVTLNVSSPDLPGYHTVIANSGLIRAHTAITADISDSVLNLNNSGKIVGDITLGGEVARIVNTGLIHGDIQFGSGDDLYNGAGGRLEGAVMGGLGADALTGGLGSDTFRYDQLADSTVAASDLIKGLQAHDIIDLSRIDADAATDGQQHLTSGQVALTYDSGSGNTWLDVDTGGEAGPEMRIVIAGDHTDFTGIVL